MANGSALSILVMKKYHYMLYYRLYYNLQTDPRRKCLTLILQGSFCRFLVMIDTMICTHKLYTELVMASQFGAYSFITKHSMILICYHLVIDSMILICYHLVIFLYQVPLNKVRLNLCGCLSL